MDRTCRKTKIPDHLLDPGIEGVGKYLKSGFQGYNKVQDYQSLEAILHTAVDIIDVWTELGSGNMPIVVNASLE